MYYFVREGFQDTNISEGFCHKMTLTSEMINGVMKMDGHTNMPIALGDQFVLTMNPKFNLKCMRLFL